MATTTTVTSVGLLGGGLAAAAVAGAVGLGLAGLALAGKGRRGGNKGYGYGGYGHGGGGGGGYGYGGGYGHHRGRRATDVYDEEDIDDDVVDDDNDEGQRVHIENVLEMVKAQDVTGCGRRLVCELGSADPRRLTVEELSILNLVGDGVVPGEGVLPPGGASGHFKTARGWGESGGDCGLAYHTCPLNGKQLMQLVMEYLP
ncbi:hypothetical protein Pmani_022409 [Petrolisthes manimaculis]|uniref:Uncharacterized protein n=1 Tax=Petrolisthes manimaculis TaxID=1843537 RepID=A0AAE1U160_9EUCA|nr:hypothetical protein Pmani_022409 [Petrolisthes manimaculis]